MRAWRDTHDVRGYGEPKWDPERETGEANMSGSTSEVNVEIMGGKQTRAWSWQSLRSPEHLTECARSWVSAKHLSEWKVTWWLISIANLMWSGVTQDIDFLGMSVRAFPERLSYGRGSILGWVAPLSGQTKHEAIQELQLFRPPDMDWIAEILSSIASLQHASQTEELQVVSISILQLVIVGPLCPTTWASLVNMFYNRQNLLDLFPRPLYLPQVTNSETWKFCVVRPKGNCVQRQKRSRH